MSERRFDKTSTTDQVLEGIDLAGKVVLVTGASSGLGAEASRALASKGAAVTLTGRDLAKTEAVAAGIRASTGNERIDVLELHLDRPEQVRGAAKAYLERHPRLDLLINNAGVMACPLGRTAEGWELQFATNHLGHFLLTGLLAPALRAAAPSRVVALSSGAHLISPVVFDDIHFESREYEKLLAYGQSKTANVLFAVELDKRLGASGVRANAVHPGVILTELGRHLTPEDISTMLSSERKLEFKPVEAGAATEVFAATAPELEGRGGLYLEDCQVSGVARDDAEPGMLGCAPHALDPEQAARLWTESEKLLGQSLPLD